MRLRSIGEFCAFGVDVPSCPLMRKRTLLALAFSILDHDPRDEAEDDSEDAGPGVVGDCRDRWDVKDALENFRVRF